MEDQAIIEKVWVNRIGILLNELSRKEKETAENQSASMTISWSILRLSSRWEHGCLRGQGT